MLQRVIRFLLVSCLFLSNLKWWSSSFWYAIYACSFMGTFSFGYLEVNH